VALALALADAPAAPASGPLLGGYGGPGAGAQTIVGATLINGPGSGSGGGAGGGTGAGGGASAGSGGSTSSPVSAASSAPPGGSAARANPYPSSPSSSSSSVSAGAGGPRAPRRGGGARGDVHGGSAGAVVGLAVQGTGASWLTGADLLVLALAAGVLALVALATLRLAAGGGHE